MKVKVCAATMRQQNKSVLAFIRSLIFINVGPENMYMYEGQDYSRASDKDRSTFDQLLAGLISPCMHACFIVIGFFIIRTIKD